MYSLEFCRAIASALCPLPGEVTPGAGQDARMRTRDWIHRKGVFGGTWAQE